MGQTPDLSDVIDTAIEDALRWVFTAMPGRVLSYDKRLQRVDVQPDVLQHSIAENGDDFFRLLGVIRNVPLMWPGVGTNRLTFPIEAGDTVMLQFMNCDIDRWKTSPTGSDKIVPRTFRRFSLSDAVAIPGLSQEKRISLTDNVATDRIQLGNVSGPKVEVDENGVYLGGSASSAEGRATEAVVVQTALNAFGVALNAAITSAGSPANASLIALRTALNINSITGLGWGAGTTKTKAK